VTVALAAKFVWDYGEGSTPRFGPAIIAASDRMVTTGQTEHILPIRKGHGFDRRAHMLAGGAIQIHSHLLRLMHAEFEGYREERSIWEYATKYAELFRAYRGQLAEQRYLAPLGLTLERFYSGAHSIPEAKVLQIMSDFESMQIEFEALFCGYDTINNSCILEVDNFGTVINHDDIGFGAIGIGGDAAKAHLMFTGYTHARFYFRALWDVFCAKKRGEAAAGVGTETDFALLTRNGWEILRPEFVREVEKIYDKQRRESEQRSEKTAVNIADIFGKLYPPPPALPPA
jgi:hypothetical protein